MIINKKKCGASGKRVIARLSFSAIFTRNYLARSFHSATIDNLW